MSEAGNTLADFRDCLEELSGQHLRLAWDLAHAHVRYNEDADEGCRALIKVADQLIVLEDRYLRAAGNVGRLPGRELFAAYAAAEVVRRLGPGFAAGALSRVEDKLLSCGVLEIAFLPERKDEAVPRHEHLLQVLDGISHDPYSFELRNAALNVPERLERAERFLSPMSRRTPRAAAEGRTQLAEVISPWRKEAVDGEYDLLSARHPLQYPLAQLWARNYSATQVGGLITADALRTLGAELDRRCPELLASPAPAGPQNEAMLLRITAYCGARDQHPAQVIVERPPQPSPIRRVLPALARAAVASGAALHPPVAGLRGHSHESGPRRPAG